MSDLLTAEEKAEYSLAIQDIHDTWKRPVLIWKNAEQTIIDSTENFNYFYRNSPQLNQPTTYEAVSGVFDMRIRWGDPTKDNNLKDLKPEVHGNLCRMKMEQDAFDFLSNDAKHIEIDGRKCVVEGFSRPHGLFDIQYYTVFVRETN
jgi:hypothetical protein